MSWSSRLSPQRNHAGFRVMSKMLTEFLALRIKSELPFVWLHLPLHTSLPLSSAVPSLGAPATLNLSGFSNNAMLSLISRVLSRLASAQTTVHSLSFPPNLANAYFLPEPVCHSLRESSSNFPKIGQGSPEVFFMTPCLCMCCLLCQE